MSRILISALLVVVAACSTGSDRETDRDADEPTTRDDLTAGALALCRKSCDCEEAEEAADDEEDDCVDECADNIAESLAELEAANCGYPYNRYLECKGAVYECGDDEENLCITERDAWVACCAEWDQCFFK